MRALDKKLLRDFKSLWAQALAIALVMSCGVAVIIISIGAARSLEDTRSAFYERQNFATVFATATRVPRSVQSRLRDIQGVSSVEARMAEGVVLDIEGMSEPATGLMLSLPDFREPDVNRLYLRKGRLPEAGRDDEVAVIERFAKAHGFEPGNTLKAVVNGYRRTLRITGIVMSAEFIYSLGPGDMVPDERRFGVIYMPESTLESALDMEGAFNNIVLTTVRGADIDRILEQVDQLLKPYGGNGSYARKDQMSHAFLDSELKQLRAMAQVIPPVFLFVSAFLVNMILSRLIQLERQQIGLLKAIGYTPLNVAIHYAKLVLWICVVGLTIGFVSGTWIGQGLTKLYAQFFSFPFLLFTWSIDLYVIAGVVGVVAALTGALWAIRKSISLAPAVAMRPPAPAGYRTGKLSLFNALNIFSQLVNMAIRHLVRRPLRSLLTTLGIAMAVASLITSTFAYDSIDFMIDTVFYRADRQDAMLGFTRQSSPNAIRSVEQLPSVIRAEPYRATSVRLRADRNEEKITLMGYPANAELGQVLDDALEPMAPAQSGLMISDRLANKLDVRVGDLLQMTLLNFNDRTETVAITGIVQSYIGLVAVMELDAMDRVIGTGPRISGVRVKLDSNQIDALYAAVKKTPAIGSVALQGISRQRFRDTIEENISMSMTVYVALAVIISFGVVYNTARILLSERSRELASLRVMGFTKPEVARVLFIEIAIVVLLAQPLGWLLGYGLSALVVSGLETDLFRIPLVLQSDTFGFASLVVIGTSLLTALLVSRRVNSLEMVGVLKSV